MRSPLILALLVFVVWIGLAAALQAPRTHKRSSAAFASFLESRSRAQAAAAARAAAQNQVRFEGIEHMTGCDKGYSEALRNAAVLPAADGDGAAARLARHYNAIVASLKPGADEWADPVPTGAADRWRTLTLTVNSMRSLRSRERRRSVPGGFLYDAIKLRAYSDNGHRRGENRGREQS